MEYLGYLLGPLGCVVGMVVCMAMMARGGRRREADRSPAPAEESAVPRPDASDLRGSPSGSDA